MSNAIVRYLVTQIILKHITYNDIIVNRPDLKDAVDKYISDNGLYDTINKTE